jgi:hypothetical protein
MQVDPEPSLLRKSPPWHMKFGICSLKSVQDSTQHQRYATNYAVELGALVPLGTTGTILALAGAELTEVLSCLWYDILEEFDLDAAKRLT